MDGAGEVKSVKSVVVNAREEGELSSSDNDENDNNNIINKNNSDEAPVCSTAHSTGIVNRPAPAGTILSPPLSRISQGMVKNRTYTATSNAVQSGTSIKGNSDRSFEKNHLPFKSSNPTWNAPPGANNNLVISFSDNDSGTDSEGEKHEKGLQLKRSTTGVVGNQGLPSLSSTAAKSVLQSTEQVGKGEAGLLCREGRDREPEEMGSRRDPESEEMGGGRDPEPEEMGGGRYRERRVH